MSERIVNDPSQHGWVEVDGKWVWGGSGNSGDGGGAQDSLWVTENNSVTYRSSDDSGVFIYDTRDAGMFNRAQMYLVNEQAETGGWLGAQSDAFQLGYCAAPNPDSPEGGARTPIVTLHSNGQCSVGNWQLPPTDEKFYVNGKARITDTIQATDYLDANGNSVIGGGGTFEWATVTGQTIALGISSSAEETGSVVVGNYSVATAYGAVAVGINVKSEEYTSTAIGYSSSARAGSGEANSPTAVGGESAAIENGTSLGGRARSGKHSVAVGNDAIAEHEGATAIGYLARPEGGYSISLGYSAKAKANEFAISELTTQVNFSHATVQAADFLHADGNPIMQTLTQAEYDGITPDANTVYCIV